MRANLGLRRSDCGPSKAVMTNVKLPFRDSPFGSSAFRFEIRISTFHLPPSAIPSLLFAISVFKSAFRHPPSAIRHPILALRNPQSDIPSSLFALRPPPSEIRIRPIRPPPSEIPNRRFRHPRFAILNPTFPLCHPIFAIGGSCV